MQEAKLSVFSPAYWRTARAEFRNVRVLAFAGLVCAMAIVLEGLPIYLLGPSLKIYFSFLVVGLGCMCYGPCVGMMAGAIIDSVGFLLSSYGRAVFPRLPRHGGAVGLHLRRAAVQAQTNAAAHYCGAAYYQLRQQRAAGQRVEGHALRQGLSLLPDLRRHKNTLMLPVEVFLMWAVLNAAVNYGLDRKYIHKR